MTGHLPLTVEQGPVSFPDVIAVIKAVFGVTRSEILSDERRRPVMDARRIAYRLVHDECWYSWPRTAEAFGVQPGGSFIGTAMRADPDMLEDCRRILRTRAAAVEP